MSRKKELIENYFKDETIPKIPTSLSKSTPSKYTKHALHDNPDTCLDLKQDEMLSVSTSFIYINPHKVDRINLNSDALATLANSMATIGQSQPCIVRKSLKIPGKKYELIFGERRYKAALLKNIDLKIIIKSLTDSEAALLLLSENKEREDNTDYELGEQLSEFLDNNILAQKDIVINLGISKQRVSKLLSFRKIPLKIKEAIDDFTKVTATTAESIVALSNDKHKIDLLIEISDKIRTGKFGHSKIKAYISNKTNALTQLTDNEFNQVFSSSGRHIFTWRVDNNKKQSIHFPKNITDLITQNKIKIDVLTNDIILLLEKRLNEIENCPPGD